MLMARDATTTTVIREKVLSIIISSLARAVSGMTSAVLNAWRMPKPQGLSDSRG